LLESQPRSPYPIGAFHDLEQYTKNRVESDHGRLKAQLHPRRGLKIDKTAQVIVTRHAFAQNLSCGHYDIGVDAPRDLRLAEAFAELNRCLTKSAKADAAVTYEAIAGEALSLADRHAFLRSPASQPRHPRTARGRREQTGYRQ
jgi:hypothetical protein